MKKNFTDFLISLLVIVCSLVLLGALAYALSGWGTRKGGRTVEIDFVDVTGVHLHSEVRYAGAPAGAISAVRLLTFKERNEAGTDEQKRNAVRVTATLREDVPPIPADVRVSISSDSMLSDKFIALSAGSPDGENWPPAPSSRARAPRDSTRCSPPSAPSSRPPRKPCGTSPRS